MAVSLGLHLLLVAVLIFWRAWGPSKREIFAPVYQVQLVGAPHLPAGAPPAPAPPKPTPKPEPPAPAPPKPKPEPKPEPKVEPKPAPKPPEPKKEAIATKEAEAPKRPAPKPEPKAKPEETVDAAKELEKSLAKLRSRVDEQQRYDNALSRLEKKYATQTNQVGGAYSAGGGGGATGSVRDQVYLTELWSRIQAAWVLSEALVQKPRGLVAIVGLRIRKDGSLERTWLEQSSGNTRYDQSALRATERAAPYPPPPAGMRESYFEVGVRFRVEDLGG